MTSFQQSAGTNKAAKFINANPLEPLANPFKGIDDANESEANKLAEAINSRTTKALATIKQKYDSGLHEADDEDKAPTGDPYKRHQEEMRRRRAEFEAQQREKEFLAKQQIKSAAQLQRNFASHKDDSEASDSDDSDEEYLNDLDPAVERLREQRLAEMRKKQSERAELLGKGHGQYRFITQDEFLPECTSSIFVAVHFYHKEFQRCKIMDFHLEQIAPLHVSCKFLKIDAEKAPFFVQKLQVKTLPTLFIFQDGKVVNKLTGFEGLSVDRKDPDKWHTGRLQQWIASTGAIDYKPPAEEVEAEMKRLGIKSHGAIWSKELNEEDEDF